MELNRMMRLQLGALFSWQGDNYTAGVSSWEACYVRQRSREDAAAACTVLVGQRLSVVSAAAGCCASEVLNPSLKVRSVQQALSEGRDAPQPRCVSTALSAERHSATVPHNTRFPTG